MNSVPAIELPRAIERHGALSNRIRSVRDLTLGDVRIIAAPDAFARDLAIESLVSEDAQRACKEPRVDPAINRPDRPAINRGRRCCCC
jgi:hypothetical protein